MPLWYNDYSQLKTIKKKIEQNIFFLCAKKKGINFPSEMSFSLMQGREGQSSITRDVGSTKMVLHKILQNDSYFPLVSVLIFTFHNLQSLGSQTPFLYLFTSPQFVVICQNGI